jgi:hypothetical protein
MTLFYIAMVAIAQLPFPSIARCLVEMKKQDRSARTGPTVGGTR